MEVQILGGDELRRKLERLGAFARDLRPFWPLVPPLFRDWMGDEFDSEGGWGGSPWAPLSASTLEWKARHYPGRPILQATRAMWAAARSPERVATPDSLTLRIVDPKVGFHQDGTPRLPARPVIPDRLPGSAERELVEKADDYLRDVARRLGL